MTGDITRAITLTTYGTSFLKDNYDISSLTLDHPAFIFENKVEFLVHKKHFLSKPTWQQYATGPIEWFNKLKKEGCKGLRFVMQSDNSVKLNDKIVPDYKLASFVGGGGRKFIQTVFHDHSDFWQAREEVTDKNAPDNRIWTISYGRVLANQPTQPKIIYDIDDIKHRLKVKLTEIASFAEREELSFWSTWFREAVSLLEINQTENNYRVVPIDKTDLKTLQLLAGSGKAWCFGGMGSWNDIGFNDPEKEKIYEALTHDLFNIVNESYLAVANSFGNP